MRLPRRAQAQDNESGFYAGAGVGQFDVKIDNFDDVDDTIDRYDSDDTAWKAFGGWRMNPYLAFELAYVNLGSPDDEILPDTDLTRRDRRFRAVRGRHVPDRRLVRGVREGRLLLVQTRRAGSTTPIGSASDDDSDSTFTWSAGVGVNVFERVNVRLEYEQFDFDTADDAEALWLTGAYRF